LTNAHQRPIFIKGNINVKIKGKAGKFSIKIAFTTLIIAPRFLSFLYLLMIRKIIAIAAKLVNTIIDILKAGLVYVCLDFLLEIT
jgi:hypothetical protein